MSSWIFSRVPSSQANTAQRAIEARPLDAARAGSGAAAGKKPLGIVECGNFVDRLKPYADRSKAIMNARKVED